MEGLAVDAGGLGGRRHVAVVAGQQIAEVGDLEDLQPALLGVLERQIASGNRRPPGGDCEEAI